MSSEEKTEQPTAKKKRESRKEGQVARTQDLGGWGTVLIASIMLPKMVAREFRSLRDFFVLAFQRDHQPDAADALLLLGQGMKHCFLVIVLLGLVVMVLGVAATLAQGGFYLATKAMKPKLKKFDPIAGAKRMFGPNTVWEGAKILLKSAVLGLVVYRSVIGLVPILEGLMPFDSVVRIASKTALTLIRNVALAGLLIGAADYLMARRRIGKSTRMTKQEVKEEYKNTEGKPEIKSAIKSKQLAIARQRMMGDVPTADVVLVNPTHIAVALRYDPAKGAPTVVALGAGVIAARIREIASENRVPIVRDVPLARALHRHTKVGQQIPNELFAAVATVLAFVITQKRRGFGGGEHTSPRGDAPLPELPKNRRRKSKATTETKQLEASRPLAS